MICLCQYFRGIFELINLMKIDMANFELQTLKPVLIQQAVKYEKEKFAEFLEQNSGENFFSCFMNVDCLRTLQL